MHSSLHYSSNQSNFHQPQSFTTTNNNNNNQSTTIHNDKSSLHPVSYSHGYYRKSNVTGQLEEYLPHHIRYTRRMINFGVVATFLIALFVSVMDVILLRVYVSETGVAYGTYFISITNALVIMFFSNIYGILAEKLNEWENYKTETEYENNLIIKIFIFRFINSYATLYYICFSRRYESLHCEAEDCMEDLAAQLGTIFITQLTVSNAIELGSLAIARLAKGVTVSYFTEDEKDWIWAQYSSEIYVRTFDDYCEILVSFGYATLFVISFPLAPLAAFIGCIVEARIDGYKLCRLTRRPFLRQADDVGTWQLAMENMGWSVLVTNLGILCFAAEDLDIPLGISDTYFKESLTALILFGILFIIVTFLNYCVATKPYNIIIHMQRQDHIEGKVYDIGSSIERYLDGLQHDELINWEKWHPQKVAYFLREICYKNPVESRPIQSQIVHSKFGGESFRDADEYTLILDDVTSHFLLNKVLLNGFNLSLHQFNKYINAYDLYLWQISHEINDKYIVHTFINNKYILLAFDGGACDNKYGLVSFDCYEYYNQEQKYNCNDNSANDEEIAYTIDGISGIKLGEYNCGYKLDKERLKSEIKNKLFGDSEWDMALECFVLQG